MKKIYDTWQEMVKACKELGIESYEQYIVLKGYKKDPLLPSNPRVSYPDFPGFSIAFGQREAPYETLQEASLAAQKLGFKTKAQYHKEYHQDPKLVSHPEDTYKDFPKPPGAWPVFLGKKKKGYYKTLKEASEAAQKLGIRPGEYGKRHHEDERLYSHPSVYPDFYSMPDFLGYG